MATSYRAPNHGGTQDPTTQLSFSSGFDVGAWAAHMGLGSEDISENARCSVYLVTFSRVLLASQLAAPQLGDPSALSREEIFAAMLDTLEKPSASARGGKPRGEMVGPLVLKMLIARERHINASWHFHVAVKLRSQQRSLL